MKTFSVVLFLTRKKKKWKTSYSLTDQLHKLLISYKGVYMFLKMKSITMYKHGKMFSNIMLTKKVYVHSIKKIKPTYSHGCTYEYGCINAYVCIFYVFNKMSKTIYSKFSVADLPPTEGR